MIDRSRAGRPLHVRGAVGTEGLIRSGRAPRRSSGRPQAGRPGGGGDGVVP